MNKYLIILMVILGLAGCGESSQQSVAVKPAQIIQAADECHLCGMIISEFGGPKGQLFHKGHERSLKFCSTRDMFSHLLQPENNRLVANVWVHDMSKVQWDQPDDKQFIDGKTAWYVNDSSKTGAMGKTLASFATEGEAKAFAQAFGGKVLRFEDINIQGLM